MARILFKRRSRSQALLLVLVAILFLGLIPIAATTSTRPTISEPNKLPVHAMNASEKANRCSTTPGFPFEGHQEFCIAALSDAKAVDAPACRYLAHDIDRHPSQSPALRNQAVVRCARSYLRLRDPLSLHEHEIWSNQLLDITLPFMGTQAFHPKCDGAWPINGNATVIERELRARALCSRALFESVPGHTDFYASDWLSCARLQSDPLSGRELQEGPDQGLEHHREVERCAAEFARTYDPHSEWSIFDERMESPILASSWMRQGLVMSGEANNSVDSALHATPPSDLSSALRSQEPNDTRQTEQTSPHWYGSSQLIDAQTIHDICAYETGTAESGTFGPQTPLDHLQDLTAQQLCSDAITADKIGQYTWSRSGNACPVLLDYAGAPFLRYEERVQLVRACANTQRDNRIAHCLSAPDAVQQSQCTSMPFFIPLDKDLERFTLRTDPVWNQNWRTPHFTCTGPFCHDASDECREEHLRGRDPVAIARKDLEARLVEERAAADFLRQHKASGKTEHALCLINYRSNPVGFCPVWWNVTDGMPVRDAGASTRKALELQLAADPTKFFCTLLKEYPTDEYWDDMWLPEEYVTAYIDPRQHHKAWDCAPTMREHLALREHRYQHSEWARSQKYEEGQAAAQGKGLGASYTMLPKELPPRSRDELSWWPLTWPDIQWRPWDWIGWS